MWKDTVTTKIQIQLWNDNLNDLDYSITQRVIKKLIQESEFAPKIATIRKEYSNLVNGQRITSADDLELVTKAISTYGSYRTTEAMEYIKNKDEDTYAVVKAIGFNNFCKANTEFIRKPFMDMHKEVKDRTEKGLMLERTFGREIAEIRNNGLQLVANDY
jgi:hypothetical protein